jgi:soluble lytic murein transglycosylase
LVSAFAAVRSGAKERAIRELDGLAALLPTVAPDVEQLSVEARGMVKDQSAGNARLVSMPAPAAESSQLEESVPLNGAARLLRLRKYAEKGQVDAVEREVNALGTGSVTTLTKAEGLYLRGKARSVARREQAKGAVFLNTAADLGYAKPSQLRLDAAKMYVREGDAQAATKLYNHVARSDRSRADEALYYAARAQATLGDPSAAAGYYAEVLRRFGNGRYADEARYERALNALAMRRFEVAAGWLRGLLDDPQAQANRPIVRELICVATLEAGHKDKALDCLRSVVADYPLHLAGLFARARLLDQSVKVEPRAMPAEATPKQFDAAIPTRVKELVDLGLDELAAQAFQAEQVAPSSAEQRERRWQCRSWGAIGYGGRGYAISSDLRERVQLTDEATAANRWAFDCRFPRPYASLVQEFETEFALPAELEFAVMRQESGFRPEVASNANAHGLMQLLPETADRVAAEFAASHHFGTKEGNAGTLKLSEPRVNLQLGAAYLKKLLDYFDGNLVFAVAAYNAGPRAVALWVNHGGDIPMELFAARIPYAETRTYVDRVLANLAMYRYLRLGDAGLPELRLKVPKELKLSEELY